MAKDCSFDVVSEVDLQEVDNAYTQTEKEMAQRYDFKGSNAKIDFDKKNAVINVLAPSEFVGRQVIDIFQTKLIRRKVDLKSIKWADAAPVSGGNIRISGSIVAGIDEDNARSITKDIKNEKFKVKTQIDGDKVRVFSPSRDALQEVIAFLREKDYGIPLQFNNYR